MKAHDILPDHASEVQINGTTIRKGTVGAFLANAAALRQPDVRDAERQRALNDIVAALPALKALGLFDALEIRDPQLRDFVESRL
ncbi:hypothetical protein KAH39_15925 [Alcaligenes faecalis]|uniref:hypothetical protein n=1 Tax=Alcaligenes faecalis TaxID=511 RepID=UPI000F66DC66|nr:hypothetical protein [Alcaligenes faecalis]MBQ0218793.1 hypothetical protein [Alcaligenes faecalis]RSE60612.1 hypothetical protein EGT81_14010 [Alcaligenes faecalis]